MPRPSHSHIAPIAILAAVLVADSGAFAAEPVTLPARDIGNTTIILGKFGRPIGEQVTVQGVKRRNGPLTNAFRVESVNGKLQKVIIYIRGIEAWPEGTPATLRGYEVGTLRFLTDRETNLPPDITFPPHQKLFLSFQVDEIVEPKDLKLAPPR